MERFSPHNKQDRRFCTIRVCTEITDKLTVMVEKGRKLYKTINIIPFEADLKDLMLDVLNVYMNNVQ